MDPGIISERYRNRVKTIPWSNANREQAVSAEEKHPDVYMNGVVVPTHMIDPMPTCHSISMIEWGSRVGVRQSAHSHWWLASPVRMSALER